jgi:dual specificity phosphatase 12
MNRPSNNDADEIRPRIWLGNYNAARDKEFLQRNNISVVFNCTKNLDFADAPSVKKRYRIPVDDNLAPQEIANLAKWAPESIYLLLQEYYSGATILVHCAAGMQRSAATVAMFLIATEGLGPEQAIAATKARRPIAFFQNANFKESIEVFHKFFTNQIIPMATQNKKTE